MTMHTTLGNIHQLSHQLKPMHMKLLRCIHKMITLHNRTLSNPTLINGLPIELALMMIFKAKPQLIIPRCLSSINKKGVLFLKCHLKQGFSHSNNNNSSCRNNNNSSSCLNSKNSSYNREYSNSSSSSNPLRHSPISTLRMYFSSKRLTVKSISKCNSSGLRLSLSRK